ncbi:imelysin family protein [Reinekea forsetii]|nr:imelysin family protein [Reinekea forsetii]
MKNTALALVGLCALLIGCSPKTDSGPDQATPIVAVAPITILASPPSGADFGPVGTAFQLDAKQHTLQMLALCQTLADSVEAFLATPEVSQQQAAQASFRLCYQSWTANQLFFQLAFNPADKKTLQPLLDLIDTRPFLPGYIDSIPDYPYSGLIFEMDLPINEATLLSQHRLMDEDSAALGFPVVEFFLWRQPLDTTWHSTGDIAADSLIERRHQYLRTATGMLLADLGAVSNRWQAGGGFGGLPHRVQLVAVLASLQRITAVALLDDLFNEQALTEPEWHHPAMYSGQGRAYPLALLTAVQGWVGLPESTTAFAQWLDSRADRPMTAADLQTAVADSLSAVQELPENYPADSAADGQWATARQRISALALAFGQLSEQQQVPIFSQ